MDKQNRNRLIVTEIRLKVARGEDSVGKGEGQGEKGEGIAKYSQ